MPGGGVALFGGFVPIYRLFTARCPPDAAPASGVCDYHGANGETVATASDPLTEVTPDGASAPSVGGSLLASLGHRLDAPTLGCNMPLQARSSISPSSDFHGKTLSISPRQISSRVCGACRRTPRR